MKKLIYMILVVFVIGAVCGCNSAEKNDKSENITNEEKAETPSETPDTTETPSETDELQDDEDEVTPYQFLNLFSANADQITFSYVVTYPQENDTQTGTFQKNGDESVQSFTAKNMYGENVSVREIEKNDKVRYIIDEFQITKIYNAPAEDFLLYKMMNAANTEPVKVFEQDGFYVYEHDIPFVQDDNIKIKYCFYMKNGVLSKLTVSYGEMLTAEYEFAEFRQEVVDISEFDEPQGYKEETFDYVYDGEYMPPWWELSKNE